MGTVRHMSDTPEETEVGPDDNIEPSDASQQQREDENPDEAE